MPILCLFYNGCRALTFTPCRGLAQAMVEQDVVYLHFDNKDTLVSNTAVLKAPTPSILAVGPNPAFQKSLSFKKVSRPFHVSCVHSVLRGAYLASLSPSAILF